MEESLRETSTSKSPICDVCLGMYKHGLFAPIKAEGLGCPTVKQKINIKHGQKKCETSKMWRMLMSVSWQVPKFNCSNAAIKGNGI